MDVIMDGIQWFIGLGSTVFFTSNYFYHWTILRVKA